MGTITGASANATIGRPRSVPLVRRTAAIGALPPFTGAAAKDPLLPRADPRRGHHFRSHPLPAGSAPESKDGRGWCHAGCQKIIAARAAAGDRNTYPGRRCPEDHSAAPRGAIDPPSRAAPRRSISTIPRAPVNIPTVLRRAKRSTHIHPAPRRYSKCHPGRRSTSLDRMHTAEDRGNLIGWCACSALRGIALISPRFGKARRALPRRNTQRCDTNDAAEMT